MEPPAVRLRRMRVLGILRRRRARPRLRLRPQHQRDSSRVRASPLCQRLHPRPAPGVSDAALLMVADIFPTGYEVGVLSGGVRPGNVVVVSAGPVGLAAIVCIRMYSPSHEVAVDLPDSRLESAKQFGADITVTSCREDPSRVIVAVNGGLG